MTIMQLAGFPAEVVDSVVSVLCRMAFDFGLWSDGASPLLFVCEEAHRYAPADRKIGFGPTRRALSRIAKEGRKYGVFLGLVTQRPAEIDPTIISQCSTLFVMRLANDRDQGLIRSAVSDAAGNLLSFIPSLGTREVFAFGAGVALPTRMRFNELPAAMRPNSEAGSTRSDAAASVQQDLIKTVIERWRSATMNYKAVQDIDVAETAPAPPATPSVTASATPSSAAVSPGSQPPAGPTLRFPTAEHPAQAARCRCIPCRHRARELSPEISHRQWPLDCPCRAVRTTVAVHRTDQEPGTRAGACPRGLPTVEVELAVGKRTFVIGGNDAIGLYRAHSLHSPVLTFTLPGQAQAEARRQLGVLLTPPAPEPRRRRMDQRPSIAALCCSDDARAANGRSFDTRRRG